VGLIAPSHILPSPLPSNVGLDRDRPKLPGAPKQTGAVLTSESLSRAAPPARIGLIPSIPRVPPGIQARRHSPANYDSHVKNPPCIVCFFRSAPNGHEAVFAPSFGVGCVSNKPRCSLGLLPDSIQGPPLRSKRVPPTSLRPRKVPMTRKEKKYFLPRTTPPLPFLCFAIINPPSVFYDT